MISIKRLRGPILIGLAALWGFAPQAKAQVAPSLAEVAAYTGLHLAAHEGKLDRLDALLKAKPDLEERDSRARTALHIAAYASQEGAIKLLAEAGADVNAFEHQSYDIVTIAAVANDLEMLNAALEVGTSPANITSPYIGTALIAAAHLGHYEVVERLIAAGAPLDHVNNLGWTAMIEVVVLGDGGENHIKSLKALLDGGADKLIADSQGVTPLQHAKARGFSEMAALLE